MFPEEKVRVNHHDETEWSARRAPICFWGQFVQ
jgi:hypothetical protein